MQDINDTFKDFTIKPAPEAPKTVQVSSAEAQAPALSQNNALERSPGKDTFSLTGDKDADNIIKKVVIGALIALGGILAYRKGKSAGLENSGNKAAPNSGEKVRELERELETLRSKIQNQTNITSSLDEKQAKIKELTELIENMASVPENQKVLLNEYIQKYEEIAGSAKLSYDPLSAPAEKLDVYDSWVERIFKISDVKPLQKTAQTADIFDTKAMQKEFLQNGYLDITLPNSDKIKAVSSPDAFIDGKTIADLGKTVDSEIAIAYGDNIDWSREKIARDIMQNFYDGHGNTLDGVRVVLQKQQDGSVKVKIFGKGFYEYDNLTLLGAGNKKENLYNAGGFGEGSKVLVARMLSQGYSPKVTYSCADWKLTFLSPESGKAIRRKLEKVPDVLEGNSIEFETKDEGLVNSIINAVNYFKHSKNPDFQGLTFENKDFGFEFLPEGKGNIYLTQRFEFNETGRWENSVDNLNLIFKRKPDPDKYRELIGKELEKDRDRTNLTNEDVKNLTRYFAHNMSDSELLSSIVTTKPMWGKIKRESDKSALTAFLDGLIEETFARGIKLDIGDERYVAESVYMSETVVDTLLSYDYKLLPDFFRKLGFDNANDTFKKLSMHTPLQPTEAEIKKLKLLEEGLSVVQDNVQIALSNHLEKADIKIIPPAEKEARLDIFFKSFVKKQAEKSPEVENFLLKYSEYGCVDGWEVEKMSDEEFEEFCKVLSKSINDRLHSLAKSPDLDEISEIVKSFKYLDLDNPGVFDVRSQEYLKALKDFDLIKKEDVTKPRYIFDRRSEIAQNTLGESIANSEKREYFGHWVDREYLNTADFSELLTTWIHEVCHKSGGDGTEEFTYALTDMLKVVIKAGASVQNGVKLSAIEEIFNRL